MEPELFGQIIHNLPVVVFCKDYHQSKVGRYCLINRMAEEFFGHKASDMMGSTDYEFFPKHQADFFLHTDLTVFSRKETIDIKLEEIINAAGQKRFVRTLKYPIKDRYLVGVAIDITDQVLFEEAAQKEHHLALNSMKLAAVGELAASLIHEIKNPLSVAMAYMERIEEDPENAESTRAKSSKVNGALARINLLIDRFKRYTFGASDQRANKIQSVNIYHVIESAVSMINFKCEEHQIKIVVGQDCDKNIQVRARALETEQILTNLLTNSLDALTLNEVQTTAPKVEISWTKLDHSLVINVRDNGPGVPIEKCQEIFKPFVTTKRRGEGLGLGLSLSKTLAESMEAQLRCETSSQGAHFTLKLPLAQN